MPKRTGCNCDCQRSTAERTGNWTSWTVCPRVNTLIGVGGQSELGVTRDGEGRKSRSPNERSLQRESIRSEAFGSRAPRRLPPPPAPAARADRLHPPGQGFWTIRLQTSADTCYIGWLHGLPVPKTPCKVCDAVLEKGPFALESATVRRERISDTDILRTRENLERMKNNR